MTKRVFTQEQDQEVSRLYNEGLSSIKLANHYKVDKSSILGALKRQGVKRRRSKNEPTLQDRITGMKDNARILLTPSEAEQVYKIYQAGFSLNTISMAYRFGKNGRGIAAALKRYGYRLRGGKLTTKEQDEEIVRLYSDGLSGGQVAQQVGIPKYLVKKRVTQSGISRKRTVTYRHSLNHDIFDTIDAEQKAYWLGFIYAEGCVTNDKIFSIGISVRDLEHLRKLKEFLGASQNIYHRDTSGFGKVTQTVYLVINRLHLALALKRLGIIKSRGEAWRIDQFIPQEFYRHFIRGFLDGDGCLRKKNASVTFIGQQDILEWIRKVFHLNLGTNPNMALSKTKAEGIYTINFAGINQAVRITRWLYSDATVWLERKREISKKW